MNPLVKETYINGLSNHYLGTSSDKLVNTLLFMTRKRKRIPRPCKHIYATFFDFDKEMSGCNVKHWANHNMAKTFMHYISPNVNYLLRNRKMRQCRKKALQKQIKT